LLLSARVVLSRHIKVCVCMPLGPNLDSHSVFNEHPEGGGCKNMKTSRHIGIGDAETHTGRPRCFWDIGSRLGHPSKYQSRPRARRNHVAASLAMFHAPTCDHGVGVMVNVCGCAGVEVEGVVV
jgi:hypothetical protein